MKSRIETLERALAIANMIKGMDKRWMNLFNSILNPKMPPEIKHESEQRIELIRSAIQRLENAYSKTICDL